MKKLKVISYNIHKGFSMFKNLKIHDIKTRIEHWNPDIIFLQEVQGKHEKHEKKSIWPSMPQYEFLAEKKWPYKVYGGNKFYKLGHHGNAIISKYPLSNVTNYDISSSELEKRGVLYATAETPLGKVHLLCTHLSLTKKARDKQCEQILNIIKNKVMDNEKVILGGDFNDWTNKAKDFFCHNLEYSEALSLCNEGVPVKSFPSKFPLLSLDKIFTKGFCILNGKVLKDNFKHSDHVPISIELTDIK